MPISAVLPAKYRPCYGQSGVYNSERFDFACRRLNSFCILVRLERCTFRLFSGTRIDDLIANEAYEKDRSRSDCMPNFHKIVFH